MYLVNTGFGLNTMVHKTMMLHGKPCSRQIVFRNGIKSSNDNLIIALCKDTAAYKERKDEQPGV